MKTASPLRPRTAIPSSRFVRSDWRLAAAGLPVLAAACVGDSPLSNIPGIVLVTIAAPIALLTIRFLALVDSFVMCGVGMATSALGGLVLGAIGLGSTPTNQLALLGAVACGGVFGACARQRSRIQKGLVADSVPNKLVELFGREAVREFEGVQVVANGSQTVRPGEIAEIRLYLQNCHDAPGDFVVKARLPKELEASQKARVPLEARTRLDPLAVGVMKLPILTTATLAPGTYPVELEFGVEGLIGRRVRRWRAERTIENKYTPGQIVALAVVTGSVRVVLGAALAEGLQYPLRVEGIPVLDESELPPVRYEVLWQPRSSEALPSGSEEQSALAAEEAFEQIFASESESAIRAPEPRFSRFSRPRVCIGCAAEVVADEAERVGCCPNCGALWH